MGKATEKDNKRGSVMNTSLSVITVTHNSAHIVRGALAGLPPGLEIVCVDNASADDLSAALEGLAVHRIDNAENLGFGRACNIGAAAASGEYLLFMNPDVRIGPEAIDALLLAAERYPNCGVFVPRTNTADGRLWFREQSEIDRLFGAPLPTRIRQVWGDCCIRFVNGGVFMIKRTLFLAIGGFDEDIFLYFEDDDLSHRLLQRKEPLILVNDAHAVHDVGMSVAQSTRSRIFRHRSKMRSEIHLRRKYGIAYHPVADIVRYSAKIGFYSLIFNRNRLINSLGRLIGIFDWILDRSQADRNRRHAA
ncbi:glycosyltransferase family 2 protein [Mesorhizobium abyssinicae]|uniref:glycosyltransferase family 2 protein n=1 Tax=Mesorhizobium abyssinicae TaxID=1209958 RepID=UPI002A2464F0|nr:glycosyltransferase family 2 protein [Mesorhizobium abyssinicae]MDX8432640.1 glycosyltransferase family 2 protein [Mesorhizobium abyssinicae]